MEKLLICIMIVGIFVDVIGISTFYEVFSKKQPQLVMVEDGEKEEDGGSY